MKKIQINLEDYRNLLRIKNAVVTMRKYKEHDNPEVFEFMVEKAYERALESLYDLDNPKTEEEIVSLFKGSKEVLMRS